MFYCDPCRTKNQWPGFVMTSRGRCEMCGQTGPCYDTPSKDLPIPEPEKLYLCCGMCGEVFDTIETAAAHDNHALDPEYTIKPESEAF